MTMNGLILWNRFQGRQIEFGPLEREGRGFLPTCRQLQVRTNEGYARLLQAPVDLDNFNSHHRLGRENGENPSNAAVYLCRLPIGRLADPSCHHVSLVSGRHLDQIDALALQRGSDIPNPGSIRRDFATITRCVGRRSGRRRNWRGRSIQRFRGACIAQVHSHMETQRELLTPLPARSSTKPPPFVGDTEVDGPADV